MVKKMKYFVVADVHGYCTKLKKALKEAGFDKDNPNHCFISCGDLLDRGEQPQECLDFVLSLNPARRIFIRGNHEDLMELAIVRGTFVNYDMTNGTAATARKLTGTRNDIDALIGMRQHKQYNEYISECIDYYELDKYIFVHGWIPCGVYYTHKMSGTSVSYSFYSGEDWRTLPKEDWQEARWINGMEAWYYGIRIPNKTIVCGHWHTSWGHTYLHKLGREFNPPYEKGLAFFEPFIDEGIIAIDACTAYSGIVNCVVIDDEE